MTRAAASPLAHPWVRLVVGRRGSGKSYHVAREMERWRAAHGDGPRPSVWAVDPVAGDPPGDGTIAAWADLWSPYLDDVGDVPAFLHSHRIGLLAIDEADLELPQSSARLRPVPAAHDILRRGRHRGVSLLLATQRPALIAYDAWGLADEIVICQLTSKRDLDRVCELEGVEPHRAAIATTTRPGPVVRWTPAGVELMP